MIAVTPEVAHALRVLADWAAQAAAAADNDNAAPAAELLAQKGSPLGARRHIRAVRRRVAAGEAGASIVGRRYLLTREALNEELGNVSSKHAGPVAKRGVELVDELANLRAKLEGRRAA